MTRKCCLNCTYLCVVDDSHTNTWSTHDRTGMFDSEVQAEANCFHTRWRTFPADNEYGVEPEDVVSGQLDRWDIVDLHGNKLSLDTYSCELFMPFEDRNTAPLDRIWQEHQQRMQEAKDRRRFWITASIGGVTALAVIASAIFHGLEWSRTP